MTRSRSSDATQRLCVVGPGRHAPVLGNITEHVLHTLHDDWELSTIQLAVPDDRYDWTLIGLSTPTLVSVPSIVETATDVVGRRRRCRRFLFRQLPDVVMVDWWTLRQTTAIAAIVRAAHDARASVAIRCCGRLDASTDPVRRVFAERMLREADLLIGQGWVPPGLERAFACAWQLPEWKTEERQADPDHVEVVAFLPPNDGLVADRVLRAFGGLSSSGVERWRLHLVTRTAQELDALERLVAEHRHAAHLDILSQQLTDLELDRWMRDADIAVAFEPDWPSRALAAAEREGIPVVVVRERGASGPGDDYCGAAVSAPDAPSILGAIERADLARRFRYPSSSRWRIGGERLTNRLLALRNSVPTAVS